MGRTSTKKIRIQCEFDQMNEVFVMIPPLGILLESQDLKDLICILHNANIETTLLIFKKNLEDLSHKILVKNHVKIKQEENKLQLVLNLNVILIQIKHNNVTLATIKLHNLFLHKNAPNNILIKYIDAHAKELKENNIQREAVLEYEYSSDIIHLFVKKIEIIPVRSVYSQMIEFKGDYLVRILINTTDKEIIVFIDDAKLIMINRVAEEIVQFIKVIKEFEKTARKSVKKPSKNFIVKVIATNGEVSIPTDSNGRDMVIAVFDRAEVKTGEDHVMWKTPKAIITDIKLIDNKYPIQDDFNAKSNILCDTVSIKIISARAFTKLNDKTKKVAKVKSTDIFVALPFNSTPLKEQE